jgi:antitoxin ParD1/3/4
LTITLRGEATDKLRKLVADGHYAQPEDAVVDALDALPFDSDPELDAWLRMEIPNRIDALDADPSRAMTVEEVKARLLGER